MKPSIAPGQVERQTAVLVLSSTGLELARRLRAAPSAETMIFGPSCVVGVCGGPATSENADPRTDFLPPSAFATSEPDVFGFTGPIRRFLPTVWARFEAIVAVMPVANIVRLVGPLAGDRRRDPAVVAVDEAGRFAVSVLDRRGRAADDLAQRVAAVLGAAPVVTASARRSGKRID